MDCAIEENKKNCTCTYPCSNRGLCCKCVMYHRKRNELPGCFFPKEAEKTYTGSIEAFIECFKG